MRLSISTSKRRPRVAVLLGGVIALVTLVMTTFAGSSAASSPNTVPLGTAKSFAVLAYSGVTDVPTSSIKGNVGVTPTTGASITGLTCAEVTGTIYTVDAAGPLCRDEDPGTLTDAMNDATTAYTNAAGRTPDQTFLGANNQLGGQVLVPGVYRFGSASAANLVGTLTLNGSADGIWIFQATSDLIFASASSVVLTGGAQACNVFWQVHSSATINTTASISGTILALDSIVVMHGASLRGRALAQTGNVTLDTNSIIRPTCATASSDTAPARALYCDANGTTYNLEVGQDKDPPYASLNLVPAYIDPVTGAASCTFPAAVTTSTVAATTTTTATPPPAPVTTTPAPKRSPARTTAKVTKHPKIVHVTPKPPLKVSGFTG
jgi:hypothetical protein